MPDDYEVMLWCGLALTAGLVAAPGLLTGGFPLLPLFLAVVGMTCSAHRPSRRFVMEKMGEAFSGSRIRSLIIVFGAIMMIQILPVELALLMAGDVLAYVELVAAVSLIAGRARWPVVKARLVLSGQRAARMIWRPGARARRAVLHRRPGRPAAGDPDGPACAGTWAFA